MFNINPFLDPDASDEELSVPDEVIESVMQYFETADITDEPSLTVERGTFEYWDDRHDIEFRDYKSYVVSTYYTPDGDRWFVTADAGHLNVTKMVNLLKEAVAGARSRAE